jgi:tetratricopeptide (TPR) repeat protein
LVGASNNLGVSLTLIAEANADIAKCQEAISILRAARAMVPTIDLYQESRLSLALGKALMFTGRLSDDDDVLQEAVTILEPLCEENDKSIRNEALNNVGIAYLALGIITDSLETLERSRDRFARVLADTDRDAAPFMFLRTQQALGETLREIGAR